MIRSRCNPAIQACRAEEVFETGSKAGIQPRHANRLELQLDVLHAAVAPSDLSVPGWQLHALKGDLADHWSISVSGNWRLTFRFENGDAYVVNYQDYH